MTWGNPVAQCEQAVAALSEAGFSVDFFDLRSLSPWDETAVIASVERTGRLVVVHEDNHTGGFGAEVLATVGERAKRSVRMRRIARPDTHIPYNFGNQLDVLPSFRKVLETCADLVKCDVSWEQIPSDPPGQATIRALGSGPADEVVEVIAVQVAVGDVVHAGQLVARIEATKAVVDVCATVAGTVLELLAADGQRIMVGEALVRLSTDQDVATTRVPLTKECVGTARLVPRGTPLAHHQVQVQVPTVKTKNAIYASRPACVLGGRVVSSETLAARIPGWTADEVIKRTGVASRHWSTEDETVVSLAVRASQQLLASHGSASPPITCVLCSTTTPRESSPSVACQVATLLRDQGMLSPRHFAFDFNAACSGYLYGLRIASDLLRGDPHGRVLLVTSEIASRMLDPSDAMTVFLFGDAATATLLSPESFQDCLEISPPTCLSMPDPDTAIHLPCLGTSRYLRMDGIVVARTAYKAMGNGLRLEAERLAIPVSEISALIPHPGSIRILRNVADLLEIDPAKILTTLADTGNTSSSSIPIVIDRCWDDLPREGFLGLTAFGAGFTAASAFARIDGRM